MVRIPALSSEEVVRALEKGGFRIVRQRGSHVRMRNDDQKLVTVPVHRGSDIGRGLLRKILRDAELTPEAFVQLLRD